jgi:hypothetical protein
LAAEKCSACLYAAKAYIVANALLILLLDQIIFDKIFSYQANSRTDLTAEPAFIPVPDDAGRILTTADLNFLTTG